MAVAILKSNSVHLKTNISNGVMLSLRVLYSLCKYVGNSNYLLIISSYQDTYNNRCEEIDRDHLYTLYRMRNEMNTFPSHRINSIDKYMINNSITIG